MTNDEFIRTNDRVEAASYRQYLALDAMTCERKLLSSLNGETVHDETLFIVIHQNIELWFFQALHDGGEARRLIEAGKPLLACDELERLRRIFAVLTETWEVLATLRPREFWRFREYFGGASGFQSAQFRELEALFGLRAKMDDHLAIHLDELGDEAAHRRLTTELGRPSLWDAVISLLKRSSAFAAGQPDPSSDVRRAWFTVYSQRDDYPDLYLLAERLTDLSAALTHWRHKHVVTVERFIGDLPGGGGSSGVPYLKETLGDRAFPELWAARNEFKSWSPERYRNDQPSLES